MIPTCSQRLDNGKPCNAPAMNDSRFCRHHDPQRPRPSQEKSPETEPLNLPQIVDKQSAVDAVNEVAQALSTGRTKLSVAKTLLSAIRFATRLLDELAQTGQTIPRPASSTRPASVALAASATPRLSDPATTRPARYAYEPDVDPATASVIKDILSQCHSFGKTQNPAISRL